MLLHLIRGSWVFVSEVHYALEDAMVHLHIVPVEYIRCIGILKLILLVSLVLRAICSSSYTK